MSEPVWLVSGGRVLASATRTTTRAERRRGLIGRDVIDEPLVIDPCRWVHAVGMRAPIDVAMLDSAGVVLDTATMRPWSVGAPRIKAACVVEAAAGSLARWNVAVGDTVEIHDAR